MGAGRARRPVLLLACVLAAGCQTYGERAADVHARLLELEAVELFRCLGAPQEVVYAADRDVWYLARPVRPDLKPDVLAGRLAFETEEERQARIARFRAAPASEPVAPGWCRIRIDVGPEGRVLAYEAEGLDSSELNADTRCLLLAESCVEPPR